MLRTAGAPAWQQQKLGHCCACSTRLQRSSQGDTGAEKAEVLLGEQSGTSKGIREAVPALRSFLTQCLCLPCPRVENRLEETQRRRQEGNQGPRTAELAMGNETQVTPLISPGTGEQARPGLARTETQFSFTERTRL